MATGNHYLTTYYAKRIIGDNTSAAASSALLETGSRTVTPGETISTWIFHDTNLGSTYGIKHENGTNKYLKIYGNDVVGWYINMDTSDMYILGKVGIGYDPETSGNTHKLYVAGSGYYTGNLYVTKATPEIILSATGTDSYSIVRFHQNNSNSGGVIFLNGSARTGDGGANMMTIRNDIGDLRLDDNTTITGTLYLSRTTDAEGTADNRPALIIGPVTGTHLEFDGNELMAKASATTTATLYLNNNGGNVNSGGTINAPAYRVNGATSAGTNYITGSAGRLYFGGNFHIDSLGSYHLYLNYYNPNYNIYLGNAGYCIYNNGANYNGNAATASQLYVTGSSGTLYLTGVPEYVTKNQTHYIYSPNYMSGGSYYGYGLAMPTNVGSYSTSQPMGICYGRVQCYGTLCINADTDGSTTEYAIITSGRGCSSSISDGFYVAYSNVGTYLPLYVRSNGSARANINMISAADVPNDFYFGNGGANKWSITSRASNESYFLGFYSTSRGWNFRMYHDGNNYNDGELHVSGWVRFANWTGLYSPNNGAHFYPNNMSSYGAWTLNGSKNGYYGLHLGGSAGTMTVMCDGSGNGGFFCEGNRWPFYYYRSGNRLGLMDSSTGYGYSVQVNGSLWVTSTIRNNGNIWAGDAGSGERACGAWSSSGQCYVYSNATNQGIWSSSRGNLICYDGNNHVYIGRSGSAHIYLWNGSGLALYNQRNDNLSFQNDCNAVIYHANGSVRWTSNTAYSTYHVKTRISPITPIELQNLQRLNVISFYYRPEMRFADTSKRYGMIAEEVLPLFPNLVDIPEDYNPANINLNKGINQPLLGLKYEGFIPLLIKMVQTQQKEIDQLKNQVQQLTNKLSTI